ncbi:MAG: hypothetical protein V3V10_00785, partial [Planctomycetota bacterium]
GQSGLEMLRVAFAQPEATVFKCISDWLKVVFRKSHHHWDELPVGVTRQGNQLLFEGNAIDGILYRDNIKLGKHKYRHGQVIHLNSHTLRLHATESRTNFHRAGLSRQLLQYLTAEQAAPLLAASDIPLVASNWAKALTGDIEALAYLVHHTKDENADQHEIRNQLLRHIDAGCDDVTIPYLRQRVLPLLAGVFKNRIRKGRCLGAYLYVAPSTRLGRYEISVPTRMLSHEERDSIRSGDTIDVMATRYPITGHASINKLAIAGMHRGAVVYVNPDTWLKSFQGDYDGDCITILRVDAKGWQNSDPFIPPQSPPTKPMTMPRALEQAATSKRDVALGESVIADYIHHCWEKYGQLDPEELNELGTRVICAAVDRAKHGQVDWGISPDEFSRDFLSDPDRHQHSVLAAKKVSESQRPEDELRERLMLLKAGKFGTERSGWELLLGLLHDWTDGIAVMGWGTHDRLHQRICQLHATLPAPCKRTFELVKLARKRWATAVDQWKRTDDDSAMKGFVERFSGWIERTDETLTTKVLLELGKQLLRPKKKGNASLFLSQVPSGLLAGVYGL